VLLLSSSTPNFVFVDYDISHGVCKIVISGLGKDDDILNDRVILWSALKLLYVIA
jgi:hypothetical protein